MTITQIVGRSACTEALRASALQAARFRSTVLVTGPSGTGKELIARAIHQCSPRRAGPFVPVDCTSLTGELFASHLFGHRKGAFTGADHDRLGCFRVADQGTIFLDEIGELSADLQSKLLRTVQERAVVPVGSERPIPVDVRIVAATNRDLRAEVRAGRFRLDLFYRLNVVFIETMALRERPDDIEPLAVHFLDKLAVEHGFPKKRLSPEAVAALCEYSWPGNVRELQNVLERIAIFASSDTIRADAIPRDSDTPCDQMPSIPTPAPHDNGAAWQSLADVECGHIRATLARTFYNRTAAARLLDINRASLARKIRRYRMVVPPGLPGRPHSRTAVQRTINT